MFLLFLCVNFSMLSMSLSFVMKDTKVMAALIYSLPSLSFGFDEDRLSP